MLSPIRKKKLPNRKTVWKLFLPVPALPVQAVLRFPASVRTLALTLLAGLVFRQSLRFWGRDLGSRGIAAVPRRCRDALALAGRQRIIYLVLRLSHVTDVLRVTADSGNRAMRHDMHKRADEEGGDGQQLKNGDE